MSAIVESGSPDDYIFFSNRSAFGPQMDHWYDQFVDQLEKFPKIGMCGNTINRPCPDDAEHTYKLHVQTYAFLTTLKHLGEFALTMPGEAATSRQEAIEEGELALSHRMFDKNLGLTSLAWPDHEFTSEDGDVDPELPCGNMTMIPGFEHVMGKLPFVHWHESQTWKRFGWRSMLEFIDYRKNLLLDVFRGD
ncbi:MAG: hypothetical protein AAEJ57_01640 [Opitutales bacterium]